jgi:hypothetical protein
MKFHLFSLLGLLFRADTAHELALITRNYSTFYSLVARSGIYCDWIECVQKLEQELASNYLHHFVFGGRRFRAPSRWHMISAPAELAVQTKLSPFGNRLFLEQKTPPNRCFCTRYAINHLRFILLQVARNGRCAFAARHPLHDSPPGLLFQDQLGGKSFLSPKVISARRLFFGVCLSRVIAKKKCAAVQRPQSTRHTPKTNICLSPALR